MGTSASAEFDTKKSDVSTPDDEELQPLVSAVVPDVKVNTPPHWPTHTVEDIWHHLHIKATLAKQKLLDEAQKSLEIFNAMRFQFDTDSSLQSKFQSAYHLTRKNVELLQEQLENTPQTTVNASPSDDNVLRATLCYWVNEGLTQLKPGDAYWKITPKVSEVVQASWTALQPEHLWFWGSAYTTEMYPPKRFQYVSRFKDLKCHGRYYARRKTNQCAGVVKILELQPSTKWIGGTGQYVYEFEEESGVTYTNTWTDKVLTYIPDGVEITFKDQIKTFSNRLDLPAILRQSTHTACPYQLGSLTAEQTRELCVWFAENSK